MHFLPTGSFYISPKKAGVGGQCTTQSSATSGAERAFPTVPEAHWQNDADPHFQVTLSSCWQQMVKNGCLVQLLSIHLHWEELGAQPAPVPQYPHWRHLGISMHSASGCVTAGGQIPRWGITKQVGDFPLKDISQGNLKCSCATEAASEIPISPFFRTIISFIFPQTNPQTFFSSLLRLPFERASAIDHAGLLPR